MKIELKVESHSPLPQSDIFYTIHWRRISKLNTLLGIGWNEITEVYDGARLERYSSKTFSYHKDAFEYARKLKANPELLLKHKKEQDDIYIKAKERRKTEDRVGKII